MRDDNCLKAGDGPTRRRRLAVVVDDVLRRAGILHHLGRHEEAERLHGQVLAVER